MVRDVLDDSHWLDGSVPGTIRLRQVAGKLGKTAPSRSQLGFCALILRLLSSRARKQADSKITFFSNLPERMEASPEDALSPSGEGIPIPQRPLDPRSGDSTPVSLGVFLKTDDPPISLVNEPDGGSIRG